MAMIKARHKFNATAVKKGTVVYQSKKEYNYFLYLESLKDKGDVLGYLSQVPVRFKCGTKYVMDFLVFYADGSCEGIEVKGFETETWKIKKKLFDDEYEWLTLRIV